ncbi:MAG: hypothetical protein WCI40_07680 [Verrucomicrobiota bacterium]
MKAADGNAFLPENYFLDVGTQAVGFEKVSASDERLTVTAGMTALIEFNPSFRIKLKLSNDVAIEGECFAGPSANQLSDGGVARSSCAGFASQP